jgi:hypothetical protein
LIYVNPRFDLSWFSERKHASLLESEGHQMQRRMAIRLTRNEIQLLQELRASGAPGRTIASLASSIEVAHLIGAQYIERLSTTKLYVITECGRRILADATAEQKSPQTIAAFRHPEQ